MKDKIPANWEWKTLREIALFRRGSFPQPYGSKEWYDGEDSMPFVQVADINKDMELVKITNQRISKLAQSKSVFVPKGTVIISIQGSIGRVAITQYDSYVDRTIAIFEKFFIDLDKKFFTFQLKRKFEYEKDYARGATLKTITKEEFAKFTLPVPPVKEQKQIVALLEKSISKINQAITLVNENIEKIKQLDESAFSQVFEKLLSDKVTKKKLVDIADVKRGKSKHRPRNDKRLYDGDYPLIQTGDIRNAGKFITQFSQTYNETGLAQSKLWGKGTVCLTIAANIGDVAILGIDACFPDSVVGIHSKTEDNIYIYYFLKSIKKQLDDKSSASAQKNLSVEKLSDFYIPIPSLAKQQQIVSHLDQLTENNNKLLQHYQNKLQALQRLKNSILESAFKGEFKKEQKAKTFNLAFYQMQLIGLSIEANKYDNIPQGEMAIAKDMYLLDRLFQVPTKMNFANHNLGPFAPEIKKGITNKTYFGRKNFPNSQATYVVTQNEAELFKTVSADLKSQVFNGINELNSKLFSKVSPYKRAEAKELFATVLKCIEDTQSTELSTIREAMRKWKIEIGQFKTKADKFTEPNTQLVIKFIVKENWHLKVLGK